VVGQSASFTAVGAGSARELTGQLVRKGSHSPRSGLNRPGAVSGRRTRGAAAAPEIQHALGGLQGLDAHGFVHMDLVGARFQHLRQVAQAVHGHPGAVGTGYAGGADPHGGGLQEGLVRRRLAHLVEDAIVGGDDEGLVGHLPRGLDDLGGGTHPVGHVDHGLGRFGMHQHRRLGVLFLEAQQGVGAEGLVHDAGAGPDQHVGAGFLLDVAAQVAVRGPEDLLALSCRWRTRSTAMLEVTTQSARAFTSALVLA
jgi:hypothetical protein